MNFHVFSSSKYEPGTTRDQRYFVWRRTRTQLVLIISIGSYDSEYMPSSYIEKYCALELY